jgi:hypothetical protein
MYDLLQNRITTSKIVEAKDINVTLKIIDLSLQSVTHIVGMIQSLRIFSNRGQLTARRASATIICKSGRNLNRIQWNRIVFTKCQLESQKESNISGGE